MLCGCTFLKLALLEHTAKPMNTLKNGWQAAASTSNDNPINKLSPSSAHIHLHTFLKFVKNKKLRRAYQAFSNLDHLDL